MKGVIQPPDLEVFNRFIVLDSRVVLAAVKLTPVNLDLKKEDEQDALHGFYQELLDTLSYPVYIYSRQGWADLDQYVDKVEQGEGFPGLRSSYTDFCQNLVEKGVVETEHFVVVRGLAGNHGRTTEEVERRIQEVSSLLSGGDLEVERLENEELEGFVRDSLNRSPVPTREYCAAANQGSSEYRKLVYLSDYPSQVGFGWPRHLLRVDGLVDVVQAVKPVSVGAASKKLRRQSEKLDAEIAAFLTFGYRGTSVLERSLDDVEWFQDLLAEQKCQPVRYGAYVTVHAETERKLKKTFNRLKSRLRTLRIGWGEPAFRNDYAYYTDSPFYGDRLDESLLMPSLSAATGFPFGTQPLDTRSGVLYGVDTGDNTPIILDRFNWDSHSMAVIGTLGSGKSYSAKLELIRSMLVYPDLRVIVVDPKKEYGSTVEALGGENRLVSPGKEYSFDEKVLSFEVRDRGEFENVAGLVDLVRQIYSATSKNQRRTLVLIDEARLLLQDDSGRHVLNNFVLEARDINVAVHLVTQSSSHFTEWREGEDILNHIPGTLYFRHEREADHSTLSEKENTGLLRLRSGEKAGYSEALLKVSNTVSTRIRIRSTPLEHRIIEQGRIKKEVLE